MKILHFSNKFPVQNGLKQGNALSLILFSFALQYAMRKVQEDHGTHHLLVCVDDVNLLGDKIDIIKKITKKRYLRKL
jgi:hypothetical protein